MLYKIENQLNVQPLPAMLHCWSATIINNYCAIGNGADIELIIIGVAGVDPKGVRWARTNPPF